MRESTKAPVTARWLIFQLNWLLGITAGLVLAVMGVTGASMAFQDEIQAALVGHVRLVPGQQALAPAELMQRAVAEHGGKVVRLLVDHDPTVPARISFSSEEDEGRDTFLVDRGTGRILGPLPAGALFDMLNHLHRWMALPGNGNGFGRQITGFAAFSLIYFAVRPLYALAAPAVELACMAGARRAQDRAQPLPGTPCGDRRLGADLLPDERAHRPLVVL